MHAAQQNDSKMPKNSINTSTRLLVDAWRSFPIQNVDQGPSILIELDLQLPLLIDRELG